MPKAYKDSSRVINSYSDRISARNAMGNATTNLIETRNDKSVEYIMKSTELSQRSLDLQARSNMTNTILKSTELVLNSISQFAGMIEKSQLASGNKQLTDSMTKLTESMSTSVVNGTSGFFEDDNGQMTFKMDENITKTYETLRQNISDSKYVTSVKNTLLQTLDNTYGSLTQKTMLDAVKQAQVSLDANTVSLLNTQKAIDAAVYVSAGGNIDNIPLENLQGLNTINNRTDWNQTKRDASISSYMHEVTVLGETQLATNIGMTFGREEAYNYLFDESNTKLTYDEKVNAFSKFTTAYNAKINAVSSEASGYMEDALLNKTMTATDVYKNIATKYNGESAEIRSSAIESAKKKQISLMTETINNQFNADRVGGIEELSKTLNGLKDGSFDANYIGIPDAKDKAIDMYEREINSRLDAIATATNTSRTKNTKYVTEYENQIKSIKSNFDSGVINGKDAVKQVTALAVDYKNKLDGSETTSYMDQIDAASNSFISKLIDDYIPIQYKDSTEQAFNGIKIALGLNVSNAKMTTEMSDKLAEINEYFYGAVADFIYEKGNTATGDEIKAYIQDLGQSVAITYAAKRGISSKVTNGDVLESMTASGNVSSFNKANDFIVNNGDKSFLYDDDANENKAEGIKASLKFITPGAQETFNKLGDYLAEQVAWAINADEGELATLKLSITPGRDDNDRLILSPIVTDSHGNMYRARAGYIEIYDSEKNIWQSTRLPISPTKEAMNKARRK